MRKSLFIGAAAAALAIGTIAAPAASAYDAKAYSYAAAHMPAVKTIPKALGNYRTGIFFSASVYDNEIYLCQPTVEGRQVSVKGAKMSFNAGYRPVKLNSLRSVNVNVWQFANASAAIKAFRSVERESKKCAGEKSSSYTDDDGTTYTYSSKLSNGKVPAVTVTGVQSIFIETDYRNASTDGTPDETFDSYMIYTLVNDVIIGSTFNNNVEATVSKAERKAMSTFAFRNVDSWLG
jgi:hypothetical protein